MLDATTIRLLEEPGRALYESYYFRGTSPDGNQAFWLKHNMLRYVGSDDVWLEGTLVLFDRKSNRTSAVFAHEAMDADRFARMSQIATDWDHVALELRNGSSVQVARDYLGGDLRGEGGRATWELKLHRSGLGLQHFPHETMYHVPWPGNRLTTPDCHVDFLGSVSAGGLSFDGIFHGMNGHNWGSGHAHAYAYANCCRFGSGQDAYFDGFSARVGFAGDRIVTPWITMASLHLGGEWHHFNSLSRSMTQKVVRADACAWKAELSNATHRLEVDIDGGPPGLLPWATLHYDHPDRRRAVVKNTKFASLKLRLLRGDGQVQEELSSDVCELETLVPGEVPRDGKYLG